VSLVLGMKSWPSKVRNRHARLPLISEESSGRKNWKATHFSLGVDPKRERKKNEKKSSSSASFLKGLALKEKKKKKTLSVQHNIGEEEKIDLDSCVKRKEADD